MGGGGIHATHTWCTHGRRGSCGRPLPLLTPFPLHTSQVRWPCSAVHSTSAFRWVTYPCASTWPSLCKQPIPARTEDLPLQPPHCVACTGALLFRRPGSPRRRHGPQFPAVPGSQVPGHCLFEHSHCARPRPESQPGLCQRWRRAWGVPAAPQAAPSLPLHLCRRPLPLPRKVLCPAAGAFSYPHFSLPCASLRMCRRLAALSNVMPCSAQHTSRQHVLGCARGLVQTC